jgi:uncharacterized protein YndB with AHSA1/START domain
MAELTREVVMDASPTTIFPFLTDPAQHVRWMGTQAELDPRLGGTYRVLVQGKHPGVGEFVEVVPDRKVVFTFGWDEPDHPIPAGSTEVEITLIPDGGKTRVRLVHRGLPDDAVADHTQGWDHYLDRLAVASAGGNPGPDMSTETAPATGCSTLEGGIGYGRHFVRTRNDVVVRG